MASKEKISYSIKELDSLKLEYRALAKLVESALEYNVIDLRGRILRGSANPNYDGTSFTRDLMGNKIVKIENLLNSIIKLEHHAIKLGTQIAKQLPEFNVLEHDQAKRLQKLNLYNKQSLSKIKNLRIKYTKINIIKIPKKEAIKILNHFEAEFKTIKILSVNAIVWINNMEKKIKQTFIPLKNLEKEKVEIRQLVMRFNYLFREAEYLHAYVKDGIRHQWSGYAQNMFGRIIKNANGLLTFVIRLKPIEKAILSQAKTILARMPSSAKKDKNLLANITNISVETRNLEKHLKGVLNERKNDPHRLNALERKKLESRLMTHANNIKANADQMYLRINVMKKWAHV